MWSCRIVHDRVERSDQRKFAGASLLLFALLCSLASPPVEGADRQVRPSATYPGAPPGSGPYTTNNDDSCDITVQPAATLLLPYFEADIQRTDLPFDQRADTTFTITNTSELPQILKVQTWTDRGWPLFSYNLYLTGYDVQRVSMREILTQGQLPDALSGAATGERSQSLNPEHLGGAILNCSSPTLVFDEERLRETRRALTEGVYYTSSGVASDRAPSVAGDANGDASLNVSDLFYTINHVYGGGPSGLRIDSNDDGRDSIADALALASHLFAGGPPPFGVAAPAIGYVTVDVVADCGGATPLDATYFTTVLLYDNVLMGDYQMTNPNVVVGNWANSYDMVHIRAIPEGGPAGVVEPTNLPYTFYDMYVPLPGIDRRQPLPNTFATHYLELGNMELMMWREGLRIGDSPSDASANAIIPAVEVVRFDESTSPTQLNTDCQIAPCPPALVPTSAVSSKISLDDAGFVPPDSFSGDLGGWLYLNLNNGGPQESATFRTTSQNWVVARFTSEGRYASDLFSVPLGNGCSPDPGLVDPGSNPIAPAPNSNP